MPATVYAIEHDDRDDSGEGGHIYIRGLYAEERDALDDMPKALPADKETSHWSPGPHGPACCSVGPLRVEVAPIGVPFRPNWWR